MAMHENLIVNWIFSLLRFLATGNTSNLYGGCDIKTIQCSDGNSPRCTYAWKDSKDNEVSSSSSMEMVAKPNGNYTCWATCNSNSASCSYVAKTLNYRCPEHNSKSFYLVSIFISSDKNWNSLMDHELEY